jgi:hypothetical protein
MRIDTKDIRLDTVNLDHATPDKVREALVWLAGQYTVLQKAVSDAGLVRELDDETCEWLPRLVVINRHQFGAWLAGQLERPA